ncbi:MAG TPA: hypothetical protein VE783_08290 [Candidatus Limnocylindrales bacterium]|jgi:hypothetical protein|nr:hypothetical protein [Candidatus Limnocylindrales bacterium]
MNWAWRIILCCATVAALFIVSAHAQTAGDAVNFKNIHQRSDQASDERGLTAYEDLRGVFDSAGSLLKVDSSAGYDFNRHLGVFAGLPFYMAHDSINGGPSANPFRSGMGDVYFGADVHLPAGVVDYSTSITLAAPTGRVSDGFSTGHFTADWNNRLRHSFGRVAPYVSAGFGNTVPDSPQLTRTFSSRGSIFHSEEGLDVNLTRRVYAGGAAYQIIPFGRQEIFNRLDLVAQTRDGKGGGNNHPGTEPGDNGAPGTGITGDQPTIAGNDLTREHGFDAWLGFEPTRVVRMEIGYSRSFTFALNRLSFDVGINIGRLLRTPSAH